MNASERNWKAVPDARTRKLHMGTKIEEAELRLFLEHAGVPRPLGRFNCAGRYVPTPAELDPNWGSIDLCDVASRFPLPAGDVDQVGALPITRLAALEGYIRVAIAFGEARGHTVASLAAAFRRKVLLELTPTD